MKLIKLTLKNFNCHEHLEVDFKDGVTAILGRNGSGKSSIGLAIKYALSGYLPGNVAEYIRGDSDSKSESSVTLQFQPAHGLPECTIMRSLRPRKARLVYGDTALTKVAEIDTYLRDTIGIDAEVIKNILIVGQEDFVEFFNLTPAVRQDVLQRIFSIKYLEEKRKKLNEYAKQYDIVDTRLDADIAQLEAHIGTLPTALMTQEECAERLKGIHEALNNYQNLLAEFNERRGAITASQWVRDSLDAKRKAKAYTQAQLDGILLPIHATTDQPNECEKLNKLMQDKEKLAQEIYQLNTLCELIANAPKQTPAPASTLLRITELRSVLAVLSDRINSLNCIHGPQCPTCGAEVPHKDVMLEKLYAERTAADSELNQLTAGMELIDRQRAQYDAYMQRVHVAFNVCAPQITGFPVSTLEEATTEVLCALMLAKQETMADTERAIEQQKPIAEAYNAQREEFVWTQNRISQLRCELEFIDKEIVLLEEHPMFSYVTHFTLSQCDAEIATLNSSIDSYRNLEATTLAHTRAREEFDRCQVKLLELRGRKKAIDEMRTRHEHLANIVKFLHYDRFPLYLVNQLSLQLMALINEYLRTFSMPYSVVFNDTAVLCTFASTGVTLSADKLSGGQKVILALAWRLALHQMFSVDNTCGFLLLDEPTNNLDTENIDNFAEMIRLLVDSDLGKDMQILVITHAESLAPLFTNVVKLK